jgi:phosphatidate cytidylyltransferase
MGIFILIGAWEWARICGWQTPLAQSSYVATLGLSLVITYYLLIWQPYSIFYILAIACLWWLIAGQWVWCYQHGYDALPTQPWIKAGLGFLILLPAWSALFVLLLRSKGMLIFLLVLIWTADSAAYFAGKRWGHHKLADKVSPSKTWEGVAGGLLGSLVVAIGLALFMPWGRFFGFLEVCLVTVIASILGDLSESLFKRQMGLKDSGQILPGHGGVLDRIDSLTAAAPVFVVGVYFSGYFWGGVCV